jgi:hypothetical protein
MERATLENISVFKKDQLHHNGELLYLAYTISIKFKEQKCDANDISTCHKTLDPFRYPVKICLKAFIGPFNSPKRLLKQQ